MDDRTRKIVDAARTILENPEDVPLVDGLVADLYFSLIPEYYLAKVINAKAKAKVNNGN